MPQPHISISLLQTSSVRILEQGAKEQDATSGNRLHTRKPAHNLHNLEGAKEQDATSELIQKLKAHNLHDVDEVDQVVLVCLRLCVGENCFFMSVCVIKVCMRVLYSI
jgi:hypothetical protein